MRILIVDDDYISRTKLKALMAPYGDCDAVYNGVLALQFFKQAWDDCAPYDLITLDVDMPDLRGEEVVHTIREWEQAKKCYQNNEEIKILMVSAMKDGQTVLKSFSKGCEAYLFKPVTQASIRESMEKLGY